MRRHHPISECIKSCIKSIYALTAARCGMNSKYKSLSLSHMKSLKRHLSGAREHLQQLANRVCI